MDFQRNVVLINKVLFFENEALCYPIFNFINTFNSVVLDSLDVSD